MSDRRPIVQLTKITWTTPNAAAETKKEEPKQGPRDTKVRKAEPVKQIVVNEKKKHESEEESDESSTSSRSSSPTLHDLMKDIDEDGDSSDDSFKPDEEEEGGELKTGAMSKLLGSDSSDESFHGGGSEDEEEESEEEDSEAGSGAGQEDMEVGEASTVLPGAAGKGPVGGHVDDDDDDDDSDDGDVAMTVGQLIQSLKDKVAWISVCSCLTRSSILCSFSRKKTTKRFVSLI